MSRTRIGWLVLALACAAGFASLGAWQSRRADWKAAYLADYAAALEAPSVGFRAASGRTPARVAGTGRYDDSVTLLLDNRIRDGRAGVEVFTLFRPEDGALPLLVDRGYIALPADRTVPVVQPAGDATAQVSGLRVAPPSSGLELGELAFERGDAPPLWPRLDLDVVETALGRPLDHAIVLLDDDAPHGYARAWQPLPNTLPPERHRGYAVQWFALAATVVVVALVLTLRRRT